MQSSPYKNCAMVSSLNGMSSSSNMLSNIDLHFRSMSAQCDFSLIPLSNFLHFFLFLPLLTNVTIPFSSSDESSDVLDSVNEEDDWLVELLNNSPSSSVVSWCHLFPFLEALFLDQSFFLLFWTSQWSLSASNFEQTLLIVCLNLFFLLDFTFLWSDLYLGISTSISSSLDWEDSTHLQACSRRRNNCEGMCCDAWFSLSGG